MSYRYSQRSNPFFVALTAIGAITFTIGLIVLIVGIANLGNDGASSGAGELAFGTPLMSVGGLLLVAGLVVAGIDWSIANRNPED